MPDVSEFLEKSPTVDAIYTHWKKQGDSESMRTYLGASSIGGSCERALWYSFRHASKPEFDGRMYRLFARGDLEEARAVADLRAIGCTVHEGDSDGNQFEVSDIGGHLKGHLDGALIGLPEAPKTWHVLEIKTHNAKSFRDVKSKGVEKSKITHYAQMQVYMHLTGMTRALYFACNKDSDELYVERVRYDKPYATGLMERAERIITATEPPARISDGPDYFACKMCGAQDICHGTTNPTLNVPALSCRQCCYSTPKLDGCARWYCEKHGKSLSKQDQTNPCEDHLTTPGMLPLHEPTGGGIDEQTGNQFITYTTGAEGSEFAWKHGRGGDAYSSRDLIKLPVAMLYDGMVSEAKKKFNGKVKEVDDVSRDFSEDNSRLAWKGKDDLPEIARAWKELYGERLYDIMPIAQRNFSTYSIAVYPGGRAIVAQPIEKIVEIRDKKDT